MDISMKTVNPRPSGGQSVESCSTTDPELWIGFNLLVCGPPGSGKMSFIRALSLASHPTARIRIYDFETDVGAQKELIDQVVASLRSTHSGDGEDGELVHILRHLHRIKGTMLVDFANEMKTILMDMIDGPDPGAAMRLHATCYDGVRWPKSVREALQRVFPCWIRLSDECISQRDLGRFLKHVIADLNHRYGRDVTEVDAEVIGALRHHARGRSLHELRNVIERAYIASSGARLRVTTLLAALH